MLIYIAGPLTADDPTVRDTHTAHAIQVFFTLLASGVHAFCPHLVASHAKAWTIGYEQWMTYDLAMLDLCSHVLMLPGWEDSSGACREHAHAKLTEKTIVYDIADLL